MCCNAGGWLFAAGGHLERPLSLEFSLSGTCSILHKMLSHSFDANDARARTAPMTTGELQKRMCDEDTVELDDRPPVNNVVILVVSYTANKRFPSKENVWFHPLLFLLCTRDLAKTNN